MPERKLPFTEGCSLRDITGKNGDVAHLQKEWYWVIAMLLFFLERDVLVDTLFLILGIIYNATR